MAYNPEADRRWREKNKEKVKHGNLRRNANFFVRHYATLDELEALEVLIEEKRILIESGGLETTQPETEA